MNFHEDDLQVTTTSFLGLGFHVPSSGSNKTGEGAGRSENGTQDDVVQTLMQQCMAYHQEQEALRQQEQVQQTQVSDDPSIQQHETKFVMASSVADPTSIPTTTDTSSSYPSNSSCIPMSPHLNIDDQQRIQEARARAQAVIARFHQQQERLLCTTTNRTQGPSQGSEIPPALFAEQRYKGLRREEERKRKMLLKNLDYVLMKESERVGHLTAQIEQSAIYEDLAKRHYHLQLEQRKQRLLQLREGSCQDVGTSKDHGNQTKDSKQQKRNTPSIAVYVSGLPIDGSIDEAYVRNLFRVYGSLRTVRFYRDKLTGKLKGDGLVVYNLPSEGNDATTLLLETVCTQVNPQIQI
jgi:hypothetical protein